jgi:hypothetical protein
MDNYPDHLAPAFDESGGVQTPFEEWWTRVQASYPNVPENVARFWLHEHWRHSPYSWLPSRPYRFKLVEWLSAEIGNIVSRWCNFDPNNLECRQHGRYLLTTCRQMGYRTAAYMNDHGDFPAPIIVLDNRDNHIQGLESVPKWEKGLPASFLLIEGHRRFNMALFLQSQGRLVEKPKAWVMTYTPG